MQTITPDRAASYERQVDSLFRTHMGVSYSFLRSDLESSHVAPRLEDAIHHDLDPADFAARVRSQFGLLDVRAVDAVPLNRRIANLAAFAAENSDWMVARNGSIYRDGPNGVERLSPSRDLTGKAFGFQASVSSRAVMEVRDGEARVEGNGFIPVAGGQDIDLAVERLEETYERRMMM